MQRFQPVGLLGRMLLIGSLVGSIPLVAQADVALNGISITYHGGTLVQKVKVVPLLYGSSWQGTSGAAYVQGFFETLFADGRFMVNLAEYSAGGYTIGNGSSVAPVTDPAVMGRVSRWLAAPGVSYQVSDTQIRAEIKSLISAGKLPGPDANTCYVVCLPANVVATQGSATSEFDFYAYHDYDTLDKFAYVVVAPTGSDTAQMVTTPAGYSGSLFNRILTSAASHELAETVTDLHGDGWIDDKLPTGGEIGDVPAALNGLGFTTDDQLYDVLTGANGTRYVVQKVWSNQEKAPIALAVTTH